jgi:amino acid transporter
MPPVSDQATAAPGLRPDCLSPTETLAQSLSAIAPTTTSTMTIPLVFALAGNGTWLAYLLAGAAILLMGLTISRFARYSAGSGSLYTYATDSLPPWAGAVAGLALLIAYIATGASVAGGFINYAEVFLAPYLHPTPALAVALALVCTVLPTLVAYRDVQVSARMMLWIEAGSVLLIAVVLVVLLVQQGPHVDLPQIGLHGVTVSGVRLGVVMALFSFVGFESATTLGAEAVHPHRTIPRAVIQSAVFCALFFALCAYLETLGMARAGKNLGESTAPMHVLADLVHLPRFGTLIDFGALVSMFACTLACISAAARVVLRMACDGLIPTVFARAHAKNATPAAAILLVGLLTLLPVVVLAARGYAGIDIYGWLGSLAVYGFITVYGLAAIALPFYLKRNHHLSAGTIALSAVSALAMILALAGTLFPVPPAPYNWLPFVYLGYLLIGTTAFALTRRNPGEAI